VSEIARGRDRQGVSGDIPEGTECSLIAKETQSAVSEGVDAEEARTRCREGTV
jgi:hypothetical protein